MEKYFGSSVENKKVDGDCGKAESVFNNLFKKSRFQNIKYVEVQNFLSTSIMKTFNERVLYCIWNTLYISNTKN